MNLLFLTILFPFLGFIALSMSQGKWTANISAGIGVGSVGISVLITVYMIFDLYCNISNYVTFVFVQNLWTWFSVNTLCIPITLRLDGLSLTMLSVITGIGFIIHIYAIWYMREYEGYSRFFAYTNLFIANMILLVLSDNLLLMYFGWEGVGLCSYLLIGFHYFNSNHGMAALKAFITTRFGDICLICALFMIYDKYHTLSFNDLSVLDLTRSSYHTTYGIEWISFMLLVGAVGKSAQLPLQTWLTSAMVGPTPVSALIHAATMVTSGVYLIIRMNNFFMMTPSILYLIGVIGSLTVVLFGCSALLQSNIKKILAYSTISQIGYMFLALGGTHWYAAMWHLVTHAFFKALLFLAAGSLIYVCKNEQNIFKMGGLYKSIPFIYSCFLIGGASLSGVPIITAGAYSKEIIMLNTLVNHNYFFLCSGLIGVLLTPIYTFRMIFVIFHGKNKIQPCLCNTTIAQSFPLIVLSLLSTFIGGWINLPLALDTAYITIENMDHYSRIYFEIISGFLVIFGIWCAAIFWLDSLCIVIRPIVKDYIVKTVQRYVRLLCYYGWGFDWLYTLVFVRPYLLITKKLSYSDPIDTVINVIVSLFYVLRSILVFSVNGKISWYVMSMSIGAVVILVVILNYYFM